MLLNNNRVFKTMPGIHFVDSRQIWDESSAQISDSKMKIDISLAQQQLMCTMLKELIIDSIEYRLVRNKEIYLNALSAVYHKDYSNIDLFCSFDFGDKKTLEYFDINYYSALIANLLFTSTDLNIYLYRPRGVKTYLQEMSNFIYSRLQLIKSLGGSATVMNTYHELIEQEIFLGSQLFFELYAKQY